jgi:hypothetical protein
MNLQEQLDRRNGIMYKPKVWYLLISACAWDPEEGVLRLEYIPKSMNTVGGTVTQRDLVYGMTTVILQNRDTGRSIPFRYSYVAAPHPLGPEYRFLMVDTRDDLDMRAQHGRPVQFAIPEQLFVTGFPAL